MKDIHIYVCIHKHVHAHLEAMSAWFFWMKQLGPPAELVWAGNNQSRWVIQTLGNFRPPNALPFAGIFCDVVRSIIWPSWRTMLVKTSSKTKAILALRRVDVGLILEARLTPWEWQATRHWSCHVALVVSLLMMLPHLVKQNTGNFFVRFHSSLPQVSTKQFETLVLRGIWSVASVGLRCINKTYE